MINCVILAHLGSRCIVISHVCFACSKEEQKALQAKLLEKEKELEQKQKLITDQEIFVSREYVFD